MAKPKKPISERPYLSRRRIPSQQLVVRLRRREIHGCMKPGTQLHVARSFHQNIFPNFTVVHVEKPPCFLRKFSPDGHHFIAFSSDQASLEIYTYQGPMAAADLIANYGGEQIPSNDESGASVRSKVFGRFFHLKCLVNVAPAGEQLNRECSLFTNDSRYVIVGSAAFVPDEIHPQFYDIYQNNESVTPNPRSPLEDYSLHIVDMTTGALCDTRRFRVDKMFLSHNQGLYLYKDTLAVLSVQHQTIHIFLVKNGMFVEVRTIGRFCYDDDAYLQSYNLTSTSRPFQEATINCLKHRFLVFMYKRAVKMAEDENSSFELRKFYKYFDQLKHLRMWKMQLLDSEHLLIKYAHEDVVTIKCPEPNSQPAFFVVYNMVDTKILTVYENTSEELLHMFENFCDLFRNAKLYSETQFACSPSNNLYARLLQNRFKQTIISAKFGGPTEATKRILAQLPISAQSYSSSPYLDLSLFSYDDKWVSLMERPKTCGEHPIRFYARDSSLLKFRIYAGILGRQQISPTTRRLVAFIFHPTDPFAISVQRTNTEYVVNFHIRHAVACDNFPSMDLGCDV